MLKRSLEAPTSSPHQGPMLFSSLLDPPRYTTKDRKHSPPTSPAPPTQDVQIPPPTLAPRGPDRRADPRTKTKMSTRCPASAHSGSERALPEVSATPPGLFTKAQQGCCLLSAILFFRLRTTLPTRHCGSLIFPRSNLAAFSSDLGFLRVDCCHLDPNKLMPGGMFGVGASSLILHGRRLKNTLSPRHQGLFMYPEGEIRVGQVVLNAMVLQEPISWCWRDDSMLENWLHFQRIWIHFPHPHVGLQPSNCRSRGSEALF
eukprot:XP_017445542.1 PREDICTED: uncharacterized protein LOC687508 isoform X3 [Rattus norvegicus]